MVRIFDAEDGSPEDQSDDVFAILIFTLTLTSPNGGETWTEGHSESI
ncbi:MAG: hypothetical protein ACE5JB_07885 [bacterium]